MKQSAKNVSGPAQSGVSTSSFLVILGIFAITVVSLALFSNGLNPSHYKTVHFALNYETEFLKRGLVGEAFRLLQISPWSAAPGVFTITVLFFLSVIYALGVNALLRQRPDPVLAAILVALWASPAAMPHLAADFGRFDALLLLLLAGWAICSFALSTIPSLVMLGLTVAVATLVHEAAMFVIAPIGLALWLIRYNEPVVSVRTAAFSGVILATFTLTWTFGGADILTPDDVTQMIADQYGPDNYSIEPIKIILFGDLAENAQFSARRAARLAQMSEHLQFFGFMSGFILLLGALALIAMRRLPKHSRVVGVACFMPLALYPLGYDYFRWQSFVLINMTVFAIWAMLHNPGTTDAILDHCRKWRRPIQALWFLFFLIGPLGILTSFDWQNAPLTALFLP